MCGWPADTFARMRGRGIEIFCVTLVLVAFAALIVWMVLNAGGGVLNQG